MDRWCYGGSHGGGGGVGGFKVLQDLSVLTQVYPVTVGLGGNRGTQNNESGSKGGNSVVFSQTAEGMVEVVLPWSDCLEMVDQVAVVQDQVPPHRTVDQVMLQKVMMEVMDHMMDLPDTVEEVEVLGGLG